MNPGSEYEPPTTPHQVPGRQFEPPGAPPPGPYMHSTPPGMPPYGMPPGMPQPSRPGRPAWLMPTLAAALVVLVAAGGVGAYFVYGKLSGAGSPPPAAASSSSPAGKSASAAAAPDVCAMLPKDQADRLVPDATVAHSAKDSDYTVNLTCNWKNDRISFGEFWRNREIDVRIEQHKGEGAKTGRAMAQNSYEMDYRQGKYVETAKPSLDPEEKEYVSPVKDLPGVGDSAFAQYTWRRDGDLLWYAFGRAQARVGDMTIEVRFQAGQQRKDAQILTNDSTQAITEENAIREVSGLAGHFAKGVAAWQASNPDVLVKAEPSAQATLKPSARPTPSPTELAAFPADCSAVTETATRLVPEPTTRARGTQVGSDSQTECRWLNRELSGGEGITKIRSALITVHRFTNRAGTVDEPAAKAYYATRYGRDKTTAGSSIGGTKWGKLAQVKGMGDEAYQQYVQSRTSDVSASSGSVYLRKGPVVVQVDYSGHQRPEGEATNSPKVEFMPEKEAVAGALTLAKAYLGG